MDWFCKKEDGILEYYTDMTCFPENTYGFVYMITNKQSGKFYIGKKILNTNRAKKLTKKELAAWDKPGRKPTKKRDIQESNWKEYWSSNKNLLADVKELGESWFERQIIQVCKSSKQLTYFEVAWQVRYNVLCNPNSYNDNVLAKFFRKDLENICQDCPDSMGSFWDK